MAFSFDFSNDKPNIRELIPTGTKLLVRMNYTPGGKGDGGALTASKNTDTEYLKAEFTVIRGPYKGRKFWENMTASGGQLDEKGASKAGAITRGTLRAIIDASSGLSTKDESPAANAMRVITGWAAFQGRAFVCKAGFEKGKDGYPDKNRLGAILTIDHSDYPKSEAELDTPARPAGAPAALPSAPAPAWSGTAASPPTTPHPGPSAPTGFVAPTPTAAPEPIVIPAAFTPAVITAAPAVEPVVAAVNGPSANGALPAWMTGTA